MSLEMACNFADTWVVMCFTCIQANYVIYNLKTETYILAMIFNKLFPENIHISSYLCIS